jgi:hypothetical protein
MTDHEIILVIVDLLDEVTWTTSTLERIAEILTENGYPIADL